jgi:hypothetical protein
MQYNPFQRNCLCQGFKKHFIVFNALVKRVYDMENSQPREAMQAPPGRMEGGYRSSPIQRQQYYPQHQQYGARGAPGPESGGMTGAPHQMREGTPRPTYSTHYDQGMSGPSPGYKTQYRGPPGPRDMRPSNYGVPPEEYYSPENQNFRRGPQY